MNQSYEHLFTAVLQPTELQKDERNVVFQHYPAGPTLHVACCEFIPQLGHQVLALKKNSSGWHTAITTAYCLVNTDVDISSYVKQSVHFAVNASQNLELSFFFELAQNCQQDPMIQDCLEMYTALRLIANGWHFAGSDTLGMSTIQDRTSAWYGLTPVPRMVTNQLNHLLELEMIRLDRKILKSVHELLEKPHRRKWLFGTLAVFLLLHVRELDAGRNIY